MNSQRKYIASLSWEGLQAKMAQLETEIAEIKAATYSDPREFLSKMQFRDAVSREISRRHQNLMTAIFEDDQDSEPDPGLLSDEGGPEPNVFEW